MKIQNNKQKRIRNISKIKKLKTKRRTYHKKEYRKETTIEKNKLKFQIPVNAVKETKKSLVGRKKHIKKRH